MQPSLLKARFCEMISQTEGGLQVAGAARCGARPMLLLRAEWLLLDDIDEALPKPVFDHYGL
jgi:hypothetical protein